MLWLQESEQSTYTLKTQSASSRPHISTLKLKSCWEWLIKTIVDYMDIQMEQKDSLDNHQFTEKLAEVAPILLVKQAHILRTNMFLGVQSEFNLNANIISSGLC